MLINWTREPRTPTIGAEPPLLAEPGTYEASAIFGLDIITV